jgi:hypothetical protein
MAFPYVVTCDLLSAPTSSTKFILLFEHQMVLVSFSLN